MFSSNQSPSSLIDTAPNPSTSLYHIGDQFSIRNRDGYLIASLTATITHVSLEELRINDHFAIKSGRVPENKKLEILNLIQKNIRHKDNPLDDPTQAPTSQTSNSLITPDHQSIIDPNSAPQTSLILPWKTIPNTPSSITAVEIPNAIQHPTLNQSRELLSKFLSSSLGPNMSNNISNNPEHSQPSFFNQTPTDTLSVLTGEQDALNSKKDGTETRPNDLRLQHSQMPSLINSQANQNVSNTSSNLLHLKTVNSKPGGYAYEINKMLFTSSMIDLFGEHNIIYPEDLLEETKFMTGVFEFFETYNIKLPTKFVPQFRANKAAILSMVAPEHRKTLREQEKNLREIQKQQKPVAMKQKVEKHKEEQKLEKDEVNQQDVKKEEKSEKNVESEEGSVVVVGDSDEESLSKYEYDSEKERGGSSGA